MASKHRVYPKQCQLPDLILEEGGLDYLDGLDSESVPIHFATHSGANPSFDREVTLCRAQFTSSALHNSQKERATYLAPRMIVQNGSPRSDGGISVVRCREGEDGQREGARARRSQVRRVVD